MIPIKREYITHPIVGVESIETTNIFHVKCFIILPMGVKEKWESHIEAYYFP